MCGYQNSPAWLEFRTCVCVAGYKTSPRYHVTSCLTFVSSMHFLGVFTMQETSRSKPKSGNERLSCTPCIQKQLVSHTGCSGLCSACVLSYCRMRPITMSYAGPNTVYCPQTTYDTISERYREIMPVYSRR